MAIRPKNLNPLLQRLERQPLIRRVRLHDGPWPEDDAGDAERGGVGAEGDAEDAADARSR